MPTLNWNFTSRIAVSAAALTLSILLGIGAVSHYAMRQLMLDNLNNSLLHTATAISQQIHTKLKNLTGTASALASNSLIGNAISDNEGRQRYLPNFLNDFSTVDGVPVSLAVTDFEGNLYAKSRNHPLLAEKEWLAEVVDQGKFLSRCTLYKEHYYMLLAVPVIYVNTRLPEGALVLQARLDWLLEQPQSNRVFRMEPIFQATPPQISLEIGKPCDSSYSVFLNKGEAADVSLAAPVETVEYLPGWDFKVRVQTHTALFNEPLQRLLFIYLGLGSVLIVLVILISRRLARTLTAPLRSLEESARHIAGSKNLSGRLPVNGNDEVAHLSASFNQMLEQLERAYGERQRAEAAEAANRAKSAFIANMSHELRTPMNAILGYTQILQRDADLTEMQKKSLATIKRSGEYLTTLINDILDLAKIEQGRLELVPGPCELSGFFSELGNLFRLSAQEKGIGFQYQAASELSVTVEVDEKRLRQVSMNLLGNAMKFTEQGEVGLTADYRGGELIIQVSDTGVGIPADMHEEIFKPFQQAGKEQYKHQGTGLGLAISRSLVEQMHGHIELESEENRGTRFSVHIPAPQLDAAHRGAEKLKAFAPIIAYRRLDGIENKFQILIADDTLHNRHVLNMLLSPLGFLITEAGDGEEAVELAKTGKFDVILMDLVMPKLDGLSATRRILENSGNENQRIVAVTARAFEENRLECLEAGCCEYLSKPVDAIQLLQILEKILPLEWMYAERSDTDKNLAQSSNSATISLSKEWLEALEASLIDGDRKHSLELLAQLKQQDAALADELRPWLERYEYQRLLGWIEENKKIKTCI